MIPKKPSAGRFLALTMIGAGLIAIGITLVLLLNNRSASASSIEFSAVPAEVDYAAPSLNLMSLEGKPVSLSDYRGSVVLVNLWATWCPPCREEMPTLLAFYEEYKDSGFILVAIDQEESRETVDGFVKEFELTFPVWLDEEGSAGREFRTMSLPSSYVIDRTGRVRLMWVGGISKRNLEGSVPKLIME